MATVKVKSITYYICFLVFVARLRATPTPAPTLYFTNQSNIDKLQNNVATTVIQAGTSPLALDYNSCDNRIYWTSNTEIKRSFPNNSKIEQVLSLSVEHPRGVAVDFRGNNIYFTDQRQSNGIVGVASCDGSYQRILSDLSVQDAGPIEVDSLHGYIYYADVYCCIWRAKMDGSDKTKVISFSGGKVEDLAIHYESHTLYWTRNDLIYYATLDGTGPVTTLSSLILKSSSPVGLSITNGTLYWTQQRTGSVDGTIFSHYLGSTFSEVLLNDDTLDPGDISSVISKDVLKSITGGCSNNNGGCQRFCFTIPSTDNSSDISNEYRCACPTGFSLQADNQSCNTIPLEFLLIAQGSIINLVSLDISGEDIPLPLPFHVSGTVEYIAYDNKNKFIYWSQHNPPAIMRAKLDGSEMTAIITESIALPEGIAINGEGTTLYWTDSALDLVEVVSVDSFENGLKRRMIVDTGLDHPRGLAVNEALGFLYWTDTGRSPKLNRANLNGTGNITLIDNNIFLPGPIAIHNSTSNIYWGEGHYLYRSIWRANENGKSENQVVDIETNEYVSGLTFLGNFLYWTDNLGGKVHKLDATMPSGTKTTLPYRNLNGVRGILSVNDSSKIVDHGCQTDKGGCADICVPGISDNRVCLCRDNYHLKGETQCEDNTVGVALMIGTLDNVFIADASSDVIGSVKNPISLPISVNAMDVDVKERKLYWIKTEDGLIYRSDITSTSQNSSTYVVEPVITCCYGNIVDIAVDWWGRNLYWTDNVTGVVGVAKLDGESHQTLAEGLNGPEKLVLDPYLSKLYLSSNDGIQSLPLNGRGPVTTIWHKNISIPIIDLTIDVDEHILFWTYGDCIHEHRILTNLTSSPAWCYDDHMDSATPTHISYYDNRLYFVLQSTTEIYYYDEHIPMSGAYRYYGNLDTSHVTSLKFNHHLVQPDIHWCSRTNGECEGNEALCLVRDHYYFDCRCPPTEYISVSYDKDREVCRQHCNGPESFLLLSSPSNIFYLPILHPDIINSDEDPDHDCVNPSLQPRALSLGTMSSVQAITYDPNDRKVLWIDVKDKTVNAAFLNGTQRQTIALYMSSYINPQAMTYDWAGGHIFWTNVHGEHLNVLRYNGAGSGVLLKQSNNRDILPTAVAMDTKERKLYFSDRDSLTVKVVSLKTDNFQPITIKPSNVPSNRKFFVQSLTVDDDNGLVYWYDGLVQRIEMYDPYNNTLTTLVVGVANTSQVTALTAVTYKGVNHLVFWYNQSDWSIYFYNLTSHNAGVYIKLAERTEITSLVSHNSTSYYRHEGLYCLQSPCTHLCIVKGIGRAYYPYCACPSYRTLLNDTFTCSNLTCDGLLHSCDDQSTCIPLSWMCDGLADCPDESDESNCSCPLGEVQCSNDQCIDRNKLCDQIPDCVPDGKDEENCTQCMRCVLKGPGVRQCISSDWICDGRIDCVDEEDEKYCHTSTTIEYIPVVSTRVPSPTPSSNVTPTSQPIQWPQLVAITSSIIIVFILIIICVLGVVLQAVISRRRKITQSRYDFPSSIKSSTSPQPSNMRSINTSDLSINTMETGSTHVEKSSQEPRIIKRLSTLSTDPSNPPNSPITHRSVAFTLADDMSVVSRPFSELEHPIPRAPNPSVNFDAISDCMSSVSQPRFPAILPPNGINHHELPPPPYHQHRNAIPQVLSFIDEDSDPYKEPYQSSLQMMPHPAIHLSRLDSQLDNISESTISMTTLNNQQTTNFMSHEVDDVALPHNNYYDCPPPPSPVTEFSIQGE